MSIAARQPRESEKIMTSIWVLIPHLMNTVWFPLPDSARSYIRNIRKYLDELENQLSVEEEKKMKTVNPSAYKGENKPVHPKSNATPNGNPNSVRGSQ